MAHLSDCTLGLVGHRFLTQQILLLCLELLFGCARLCNLTVKLLQLLFAGNIWMSMSSHDMLRRRSDGDQMAIRWQSDGDHMVIRW